MSASSAWGRGRAASPPGAAAECGHGHGLALRNLPLDPSEHALHECEAAYAGVPGKVTLTTHRILLRPASGSVPGGAGADARGSPERPAGSKLKLFSAKRHEIVPDLGQIEHVTITNFDAAQSVVVTLSDGSEHAINFANAEDSHKRRDELRAAIQRALSSAASRAPRRVLSLTSPSPSAFAPSGAGPASEPGSPASPAQQPDQCEVSRKITTTGIHLGERVMLIGTSQFDYQRGTLRYIGPVHFQLGETCGIELDIPGGGNSGRFGDVRYFFCPAMHGTFVPVRCVAHEPEKAAERRSSLPEVSNAGGDAPRRKLLLERPQWEADDAASECRVCQRAFSVSRRKHHCRSCGVLCCYWCSSSRLAIPYLAYFEEQRVCDDCAQFVPTFSRAAPVVQRDGGRVGLDKGPEAQDAQRKAIAEIVTMLEGSADALLMARCNVVSLLIMLATLPLEQVKRGALFGLWKVAEFAQLHIRFVSGGGLGVLLNNLKSETHPEILINAVSAIALLCENTRFRYPAARAGAIEVLLLHAMQPFLRMQLITTECLATLCQEPQCQDYACDPKRKGEVLDRMITLAVTLNDPRCQEHMFCALAHVTTQDRHVHAVAEANVRIGDVFRKLSGELLTDERREKGDRSAREHSLVHLACILANIGCIGDPVQGSACRALCDLARLHNSADLQDHVSRGLANFSRLEPCAHDILKLTRHIVVPLRVASVASFWAQCSCLCAVFNLLTLREKDTLKHLRALPNFGSVLVGLARHPTTAPVVKTMAVRLVRFLNKRGGAIDPKEAARLDEEAAGLNLPKVAPDADTGLFEPEPAVPTLFRFGDKRTYLEQVALEQAVRSSMRKRQLKKVKLLDDLGRLAADRTQRLAALADAADRAGHEQTKAVLERVRGIVAERGEKLGSQVASLKKDLLHDGKERAEA